MTAHDQLIDADPPAVMVAEAISLLENWFRKEGSVTVAFSGGADSALLAWVANSVLGEGASIVTAASPSLAGREAEDCQSLAVEWRLNWSTVETSEMEEAAYRKNDPDRCRHCKDALMDALLPLAAGTVVLGVNTDDTLREDGHQRRVDQVLIVEPGDDAPDDLDTYNEARIEGEVYGVEHASKLRPGDTTLLYFFWVKR